MSLTRKVSELAGHTVHCHEGGTGFPVLMLHGVGPGTSIMGNFGPVLDPLAERCHIVAADLIGFGDSSRKTEEPFFDLDLWIEQGLALLDRLPDGARGIAGHSLGGALALKLAARDTRVTRVLASSAIGTPYALNDALDGFWSLPADREALRHAMARMAYDKSAISDEMIEQRWSLLQQDGYAGYFASMFAEPRQRYIDAAILDEDEIRALNRKDLDITLIHGRNDEPCPADRTALALSTQLPTADLILLGECGHNLPRERPADYLRAAFGLFDEPSA